MNYLKRLLSWFLSAAALVLGMGTVVCAEIERAALPGDVKFDLRVRSAWRFR
jgi:hypothetical protein